MIRGLLTGAAATLLIGLPVLTLAGTAAPSVQSVAAANNAVAEAPRLRDGVNRLIELLEQFRANGNKLQRESAMEYLEREVTRYFDYRYMARWAAGPSWSELDQGQRRSLEQKLKELLYATLANNLAANGGRQVRYFSPRPEAGGNQVTLTVWIVGGADLPVKLDFRFYRSALGWRVFDVAANRNSAALYYRHLFHSMLREHGTQWLNG